jgi:hypothetical protein
MQHEEQIARETVDEATSIYLHSTTSVCFQHCSRSRRVLSDRKSPVGRYIKNYKNVKLLMEKGFNLMELVRVTGMGRSTVIQYRDLIYLYHEHLRPKEPDPAPAAEHKEKAKPVKGKHKSNQRPSRG